MLGGVRGLLAVDISKHGLSGVSIRESLERRSRFNTGRTIATVKLGYHRFTPCI